MRVKKPCGQPLAAPSAAPLVKWPLTFGKAQAQGGRRVGEHWWGRDGSDLAHCYRRLWQCREGQEFQRGGRVLPTPSVRGGPHGGQRAHVQQDRGWCRCCWGEQAHRAGAAAQHSHAHPRTRWQHGGVWGKERKQKRTAGRLCEKAAPTSSHSDMLETTNPAHPTISLLHGHPKISPTLKPFSPTLKPKNFTHTKH